MNTDIKNDTVVQNILYIAIGCLLASFTSRMYDVIVDYDSVDKKCDNIPWTEPTQNNRKTKRQQCDEDRDIALENIKNTKLTCMLIIGFLYIVAGVYLSKQYSNASIRGITFGGILLLLWHILLNWYKFSNLQQVLLIGGALAGLLYAGVTGYNIIA